MSNYTRTNLRLLTPLVTSEKCPCIDSVVLLNVTVTKIWKKKKKSLVSFMSKVGGGKPFYDDSVLVDENMLALWIKLLNNVVTIETL